MDSVWALILGATNYLRTVLQKDICECFLAGGSTIRESFKYYLAIFFRQGVADNKVAEFGGTPPPFYRKSSTLNPEKFDPL